MGEPENQPMIDDPALSYESPEEARDRDLHSYDRYMAAVMCRVAGFIAIGLGIGLPVIQFVGLQALSTPGLRFEASPLLLLVPIFYGFYAVIMFSLQVSLQKGGIISVWIAAILGVLAAST